MIILKYSSNQLYIMLWYLFSRDNGLRAIENLMQKKGKFDYILLETTGLADPGKKCHY